MTEILWCFPHEMRAALRFRRDEHPGIRIRNASRVDLVRDMEPADRVYAGAYCYGRIAKMYAPQDVTEVWLVPEYRHEVHAVEGGWQVFEATGVDWVEVGEPQPSVEEAWATLDP